MAKVTVIIPVCNQLNFKESLDSVLGQTYPDIEIMAVSTIPIDDNFKALLDKHKVIYIETTDIGYLKIINKALETASGEVIAYLNEGDTFSPEKIELQVKALDRSPDTGLVFTAYQTIDGNGNVQGDVYIPEFHQHELLSILLYGYIFNRSTAIFRKECYQHAMQYNGNMETELDLWVEMAKHYKIGVINRPLVKTRILPLRIDIQKSISRALDSTPLEEIFPGIASQPENFVTKCHAHTVKGAILMKHGLYKSAMDGFSQAHQLCLSATIPQIWAGILSLQVKDYRSALDHLAEVPVDDALYLDAQWVATLAIESQKASNDTQSRINMELGQQYSILLQKTLDVINGISPEPFDAVMDVQLYLNIDMPNLLKSLFNGTKMLADEWNQNSPNTPDEIIDFYKSTGNYIFELAWWHRDPERKKLTTTSVNICKRNNVKTVLDFGCGIGQDGILFSKSGFDVTLADLPGKTFDFAQWRVQRKGLNISPVNSDELIDKYDAITCFDVLEHVWEPREVVTYLYDHLSDNGILLVTTSFEQSDIHPLHLERNTRYLGKEFVKMMNEIGFVMEREYKRPMVFRKK